MAKIFAYNSRLKILVSWPGINFVLWRSCDGRLLCNELVFIPVCHFSYQYRLIFIYISYSLKKIYSIVEDFRVGGSICNLQFLVLVLSAIPHINIAIFFSFDIYIYFFPFGRKIYSIVEDFKVGLQSPPF